MSRYARVAPTSFFAGGVSPTDNHVQSKFVRATLVAGSTWRCRSIRPLIDGIYVANFSVGHSAHTVVLRRIEQ